MAIELLGQESTVSQPLDLSKHQGEVCSAIDEAKKGAPGGGGVAKDSSDPLAIKVMAVAAGSKGIAIGIAALVYNETTGSKPSASMFCSTAKARQGSMFLGRSPSADTHTRSSLVPQTYNEKKRDAGDNL